MRSNFTQFTVKIFRRTKLSCWFRRRFLRRVLQLKVWIFPPPFKITIISLSPVLTRMKWRKFWINFYSLSVSQDPSEPFWIFSSSPTPPSPPICPFPDFQHRPPLFAGDHFNTTVNTDLVTVSDHVDDFARSNENVKWHLPAWSRAARPVRISKVGLDFHLFVFLSEIRSSWRHFIFFFDDRFLPKNSHHHNLQPRETS